MATIKDVAKDSGVSLGTVSKVINGLHVREDSRLKVEASIKKLNYKVNLNARGLKAQRTNDIAVIVPTMENSFFTLLIDNIEKELTSRGKRMLICISRNDKHKINSYIEMARNSKVDGIFGVSYSNIRNSLLQDMPFVSFDRHFGGSIPCISSDNYMGGYLAANVLYSKGSKKLLCFWTGSDKTSEPYKRIDGFKEFCHTSHIACGVITHTDFDQTDTDMMYASEMFRNMVRKEVASIVRDGKCVYDGIFASSDHLAYLIKQELESYGIDVPKDVQIVGFDGIPVRGVGKPIVSSIQQSVESIAAAGVNVLLRLIEDGEAESNIAIPVEFVDGGTTR